MIELKRCPLCKGKARIRESWMNSDKLRGLGPEFYIECSNCLVRTPGKNTKQEAVEVWNTRYQPTCRVEYGFTNGFDEIEHVMECGHTVINDVPDYCPGCGGRVEVVR